MIKIEIAGREFPLAFTLKTMIRMKNEIKDFDYGDLSKLLMTPEGMLDVIYALMVSGAALEGKALDVDKDWVGERIPPSRTKLAEIQIAASNALVSGMEMETESEADQDREVDVVLEDIKKKETKTD